MKLSVYKIGGVMLVCVCLLTFKVVQAAEVSLDGPQAAVVIGQELRLNISLAAGQDDVNAIGGRISWPDGLELVALSEAGSIVSLWMERPRYDGHEIVFSGVMPGGYKGSYSPGLAEAQKGLVLSVVARPKKSGLQVVELRELQVYANDGSGRELALDKPKLVIKVNEGLGLAPSTSFATEDKTPPQGLVASIERDPQVADGQWFVVFSAYDQESGIKDFYIDESRSERPDGDWLPVGSPFVLQDQARSHYVLIKAVDWNNNETVISLAPTSSLSRLGEGVAWWRPWGMALLLLVIGAMIYLIKKIRRSRYDQ